MNGLKSQIENLKYIYQQQHYFIDRHDSMAEKLINILLVEVTALTIILLLTSNIPKDASICTIVKFVGIVLYVIVFSITLTKLLLVIRPLSKLAKDINNNKLVKDENKKWITSSLIYYQGINLHRNTALENENSPTETFISKLTDENLTKDLVQQIFILAQYSNYKSTLIQKSVNWVIVTTILGVVVTAVLIIF